MHVQACLTLLFASIACSALELDGRNCSLSTSQKLAAMSLTNLFESGQFDFDYGKDWLLKTAADLWLYVSQVSQVHWLCRVLREHQ